MCTMGDRGGEASTSSWQMFQQRALHAASQECGASAPGRRCFQPVAEVAAAAPAAPPAPPKKKKKMSGRMRRLQRELEKESPEERDLFYAAMWYKRLKDNPELAKERVLRRKRREVVEAARNEKILASGRPLEPQMRTEPRTEVNARIDPYKIRSGAYKMVLPPEEEAKLTLDQFGTGIQLSPKWPWGYLFGGKEDFVFGIFGRTDHARAALARRWAKRHPDDVMWDQDFYEDILDNAHNIELTLMVQTLRPLPLAPLRNALVSRMSQAMRGVPYRRLEDSDRTTPLQEVPLDEADTAALDAFTAAFDEKRLSKTEPGKGWVDRRGNLKEGTHIILNVGPDFDLRGEVMTPGTLGQRRTFLLGKWNSRRLARAAFGLFLGEHPVDARAKYMSGQCVLYVTNGFTLGPNPDNPNQQLCDEHGNIVPDVGDEPAAPAAGAGPGWLRNLPNVPLLQGLRRRLLGPGQPELQGA